MKNYDEQFNLRKRHPLGRLHLLHNALQSSWARKRLTHTSDVSYGDSSGQCIDLFPAAKPNAPVFVFIHGGYFRALDKRQYNYIAQPLVKAGCTVALINYDLAPAVKVAEIVEQSIKAFRWLYQQVHRWNGDVNNMVICGHSVGAFLAAKIVEHDWPEDIRQAISGVVLLSGLYDLTTMRQSYLNKELHLTDVDISGLSPIFASLKHYPQTLVAVGDDETDEFIHQSQRYADKLVAANHPCDYWLLRNKNHYTVSRLLANDDNALMGRILSFCGITR